jgi:peptidoglycan/LPS O-acetylase OafA/YrhL
VGGGSRLPARLPGHACVVTSLLEPPLLRDRSALAPAPATRPARTARRRRFGVPGRALHLARGPKGLLGHSPALDGLRGFALVAIVVYHFTRGDTRTLPGGSAAVDVFFALSGFLITALLLDEVRVHGRVQLGRFFARRGLRLLPALFLLLGVWTGLALVFHDASWFTANPEGDGVGDGVTLSVVLRDVGLALGYALNWQHALADGPAAPIPHLWSLGVEEQFYLLWPVSVLLLLRLPHGRRLVPVLALAAVSAVLPFLYWDPSAGDMDRIYFGTDVRACALLAGAVAAFAWHHRKAAGRALPRWQSVAAWLGFAVMVWWWVFMTWFEVRAKVGTLVLALAVGALVPFLADNPRSPVARFLALRPLTWLGKRSYGVYLWHYLWATWTHPLPWEVGVPLGVAGSLACAVLSWRFVEAPALEVAKRFRPVPAPASSS